MESSLTKVSEVVEAVSGLCEIGSSGSTNLIVEESSGRAGNLVSSVSSSLIARLVRVGVDGFELVCDSLEDRDPEIEYLKLASVSSSEKVEVPVEILLVEYGGANNPS